MADSAIAVVPMVIGPYSFMVKAYGLTHEVKVSTKPVCSGHEGIQSVDHLSVCGKCNHTIKESVIGTAAPTPTKKRACTNDECREKIDGKVKTLVFCPTCEQILKDEQIEDAYNFGGGTFRLTKEEYAALAALKLERGIRIIRALNHTQTPSLRYVRGVYGLQPGDKPEDLVGFSLMRAAAIKQAFSFAAFAVLRDEQQHQTFAYEHGALIQFDSDGTALLVQLYGAHEVSQLSTPAMELSDKLQLDMVRLQQALVDPIGNVPWELLLATPGVRAFHRLLAAKKGNAPTPAVPTPLPIKTEVEGQATKLRDSITAFLVAKDQVTPTPVAAS